MPTALIISRAFPPLSSAGASIRLVKFMKYIAQEGWQFIVLTQHPEQSVVAEEKLSAFLDVDIPEGTVIHRVRALPGILSRFTPGLWWSLRVFWTGLRHIHRNEFDLIYTVVPTFTNVLAGVLLSWLTHRPLILDMKDDWVGSPDFLKKSSWRRWFETLIERLVVATAKKVVLVTDRSLQVYSARYPQATEAGKFHLIPNGSDLAEYNALRGRLLEPAQGCFTMLSAAWGYKPDYRDLTPLINTLALLFKREPGLMTKFELVFLGNSLSPAYAQLLEQADLQEIIVETEALARHEFVERLWTADLFFLIQPVGNTTAISGTLYEYWAVGKAPTLLIAEKGASSQLVETHQLGRSFCFDELSAMADYVKEVYEAWVSGAPVTISAQGSEAFDRQYLAHQMALVWGACQGQEEHHA